ncbi:hypothetical protein B9Z35_01640 [Limnohabitans sp. Jir61]|uniref:hypothetical protein n=1 Tax=Limnohabitans sp. Jir61 TaxID=1826168 RepID=UPI000D392379|nr:hypothetical protein [Limnohabitans sp. Jir61]PUE32276.1 hypothetical protein B9Z35_01640 [Limnohabitans sp. Jir61]
MNKYKNFKDDALTADWLRDNGMNHRTFDTIKLNVVRAQRMAHKLLSQHREFLSVKQLYSLVEFEKNCCNRRTRDRITDASCFSVMNINTSVIRKMAEKKRKIKKKN